MKRNSKRHIKSEPEQVKEFYPSTTLENDILFACSCDPVHYYPADINGLTFFLDDNIETCKLINEVTDQIAIKKIPNDDVVNLYLKIDQFEDIINEQKKLLFSSISDITLQVTHQTMNRLYKLVRRYPDFFSLIEFYTVLNFAGIKGIELDN